MNCPKCERPMSIDELRMGRAVIGHAWQCPAGHYSRPIPREQMEGNVLVSMGGTNGEWAVQVQLINRLRAEGFVVLSTSEHRRAHDCPECGFRDYSHAGTGIDEGVADVLVSHPDWTALAPIWIGIEVKGPKTPIRPRQQELLDRGHNILVRGMDGIEPAMQRLRRLHAMLRRAKGN